MIKEGKKKTLWELNIDIDLAVQEDTQRHFDNVIYYVRMIIKCWWFVSVWLILKIVIEVCDLR